MRSPCVVSGQQPDIPLEAAAAAEAEDRAVDRHLGEVASGKGPENLAFADGWRPYSRKGVGDNLTEEGIGMPEPPRGLAQRMEAADTTKAGTMTADMMTAGTSGSLEVSEAPRRGSTRPSREAQGHNGKGQGM